MDKNRYHVLYFILTTSYNDLFHYDLVGQLRGAYYPFMAWSDIMCVCGHLNHASLKQPK